MKKIYLTLTIALLATLAYAQTSQPLYLYTQDGLYDIFYGPDIKSISYSTTDTSGIEHPQVVTQFIKAGRGSCKLPITSIDSVSFLDPDPFTLRKEGKLNTLTSKAFQKLVWDYKANPDKIVLESERPVIVDFWAKWCTYCIQMHPIMEQLAEEYKGRIDFYQIDTDEETEVSNKLPFNSLPCLFFFPKEGQPVVKEGSMGISYIREIIEKVLLITDDENPDAVKPEVDITLWKGDQEHEWTDRKFTAQISCSTSDATLVKYGCFVKKDIENNGLTEREMIQRYGDVLSSDNLPRINSPEGTALSFRAQKNETYLFICLVKNAAGGVTVKSAEITTDAEYIPKIDLQITRGALPEFLHDNGQHISIYLKTKEAKEIRYGYLTQAEYDEAKAQQKTIQDLLNAQGTVVDAKGVEQANGIGYNAVIDGLKELTDYVCMALMRNAQGETFTAHAEISTAFEGYPAEIPYPEVLLLTSHLDGGISCSVNCSTGDAIYTSMLKLPSDELSTLLSQGKTLEDVMSTHPNVSVFGAQQMEWVNDQGVSYVYNDLQPSTRYTWITDVRGRFGGRVVKRSEIQTLPQGVKTPPINVSLHAEYVQGMISVTATCKSGNAASAVLTLVESDKLEKMLANGKTLEDYMDNPASIGFMQREVLNSDQLQWFNQNGFYIGYPGSQPQTRYTWVIDARTADGKRTVLRSEIKTPYERK